MQHCSLVYLDEGLSPDVEVLAYTGDDGVEEHCAATVGVAEVPCTPVTEEQDARGVADLESVGVA